MVRRTAVARVAVIVVSLPVLLTGAEIFTDASVRFQKIEGWGTCMISWSLGDTPYNDPAWRAAYRDAGCNILRIPMVKEVLVADRADPDYRVPVPLGADLQANISRMQFDIEPLKTWAGVASWLRTNALEPDRVRISGSLWTPPHWMKGPTGATQNWVGDWKGTAGTHPTPWLSGDYADWVPDGTGDSIGGRLKTEDAATLQMYGRYLAAWVKGFEQRYGVPIYVMSLQNESTFENPFDSMTFVKDQNFNTDYGQFARALASVRAAWTEFGLTAKIMGPHVANVGPTADNPWALLSQMNMIREVKEYGDPTLIHFLSFYNSNYYMGTSEGAVQATAGYYHGRDRVPANWAFWTYAPGISQDGKGIWYSEAGGDQAPWLAGSNGTPGSGAITVALKMHNALTWSNAAAYVYWQMTDTGMDESEHTLLGRSHVASPHASKKYCSFKHFARYVRPGAQRIQAVFAGGRTSIGGASAYDTYNGVNVSAYLHETDRRLTYVLINMRAGSESLTVHAPAGIPISRLEVYRTSATESFTRLADVSVSGGQFAVEAPAFSVVTLAGALDARARSADLDGDGDADQVDFGILQVCLTADDAPLVTPSCQDSDYDDDGDVDMQDLLVFLACRTAPGGRVDPACTVR